MSQALLGIRPFPKPSSLFSYTLSDSQRNHRDFDYMGAILALGEVTLRGINNLGIRCRLATIRLHEARLIEALHPSKRQLKEIYNFLVAIIQVKEQWRHIVVEAAQSLHSTLRASLFSTTLLFALCTEISTRSTPLSTLQKAYSANMRAEMWLSLQNCGLPWQKQILRIEGIMAQFKASELDLPHLCYSMQSPICLELQSAAVFCLRQINGTRWRPVCELFGFPPIGFTSSTLECSAQELADAQNVLRKVSSNAWDGSFAFDKLVELCINPRQPHHISLPNTDAAILLTLRNICHDSGSSGTQVALCLCALQRRTDQNNGSHAYIPMAVSTIPGLTPEMEHPVVHFWREMNERKPGHRFQGFKLCIESQSPNDWISLQACGMTLDLRLGEVISILRIGEQSTPQFFDALADAVIFTSEVFGNELRNLAINCLLDHCVKSRQWDILHQVFSFDPQIERLMKELYDFVRASPPSSTQFSDLFFLLSYNMESGMF
ncbi:hypothetical protein B0H14DRAFT_2705578 [Mycena olivaceomarginata]|nr:hypothetical protein B0H14DRAFT_2705578 [Mycena olivaceomarginata]